MIFGGFEHEVRYSSLFWTYSGSRGWLNHVVMKSAFLGCLFDKSEIEKIRGPL